MAFFEGTQRDWSGAVELGNEVAGHTLKEVGFDNVLLELKGEILALQVGAGRSKRGDADWETQDRDSWKGSSGGSRSGRSSRSSSSSTFRPARPEDSADAASASADGGSENAADESVIDGSASDILKQMMERRRQQVENNRHDNQTTNPLTALLGLMIFSPWTLAMAQQTEASENQNSGPSSDDSQGKGLRMNFRICTLEMVLEYMSEAAGFAIIAEADVSGTVSVWNNEPLDKNQAVALLIRFLLKKATLLCGWVIPSKLSPKAMPALKNLPVQSGNDPAVVQNSDRMITQIIPVRYTGAVKLMENLEPLLPEEASMTANEDSNAVVLTGTENSIKRVMEIIQALDTNLSGASQIKVFALQYADATELVDVIEDLFEEDSKSSSRSGSSRGSSSSSSSSFFDRIRAMREQRESGRSSSESRSSSSRSGRSSSSAPNPTSRVVAVADERTNSLVVSAAEEAMPMIAQFVQEIDRDVDEITELRVFDLVYADAFEMSEILTNLFSDENGQNSQTRSSPRFGRGDSSSSSSSRSSSSNESSARSQSMNQVTAVPDPRTNSLIVWAAANMMPQLERMIQQLDSSNSRQQKVFVYNLDNADVDNVATILRGMFESQSTMMNNRNNANRSGLNTNNQLNNRTVNQSNFSLGGGQNGN